MQPEQAVESGAAGGPGDIADYVATMSRQLAEICILAGMTRVASLLESAADAASADQDAP